MSETDKKKAVGLIIGLAVAIGLSWYIWGVGLWSLAAGGFEKQYNLARSSGKLTDMCVRARLVAESHLQADDQEKYQKWEEIEKRDCAAASVTD